MWVVVKVALGRGRGRGKNGGEGEGGGRQIKCNSITKDLAGINDCPVFFN